MFYYTLNFVCEIVYSEYLIFLVYFINRLLKTVLFTDLTWKVTTTKNKTRSILSVDLKGLLRYNSAMVYNVAVLGAGVIGLSTAVNIKKTFPNANVTIIADRFDEETTSYGAGGIFKPSADLMPGVPLHTARRWISDSWKWFSSLTISDEASVSGNQMVAGYYLSNKELINPLYKDYVFSYTRMTEEELRRINMHTRYKYGYKVTTVITNVPKYLKWLTKMFLNLGGRINGWKISNLNELVGKYDVVTNCLGLGSRTLFKDDKIHAIRGQLIKVKADWIKCWMYTDDGAYILPGENGVTIGGVRQVNDYNVKIDTQDRETIKEKCQRLWPPLKGATIAGEWVGLRPSRTPVRLECEIISLPEGKIKVVHNYGHGGVGIALSWGSSLHATELVKDLLGSYPRL